MDGARYNPALLERLGVTPGSAAGRALRQALERSEGQLQSAVLRQLLGRGEEAARRHVASLLPALDEPARRLLCVEPGLLDGVARAGLSSEDPAVRLSIVELLGQANQPACAYLLTSAVNDTTVPLRRRAGQVLVDIVRANRRNDDVVARYLRPTVAAAMAGFRAHQVEAVLQAAILLGFQCPAEVVEQLNSPAQRLSGPLTMALKNLPVAEAGPFVLLCLAHELPAQTARAYIARCDWAALGELGRHEHWLSLKSVSAALAAVRHQRAVAEDPHGLADLPSALQAGALRLVMACGLARKLKDTLLATALAGEPSLAQAALPIVFAQRANVPELMLMALHSRCPDVQGVAAARIIAGGADGQLTGHLLEAMPRLDESVRGVVSQFLGADGFDRYWQNYNRLESDTRARAGQALLKLDRRLVDHLAGRLLGRDVNEQLQAVQMVRQLSLVDRFANTLCQLARHANRTIRSAAAMALGQAKSFDARATLARCLHDEDPRVQANAVEALAAQGGEPSAVRDKLDSPDNRTRANAIKWLLEAAEPAGAMALATMLTDTRVAHRISALWVVKTLRHQPAGPLLDRLAAGDPDAKVRARAATIRRSLEDPATQEASA